MSYLSTIVHPLIIIRLLEHRLFTPLLKKSTNTRATPSVSLSMSAACSNAIAPLTSSSASNSQSMQNTNHAPSNSLTSSFLRTSSQLGDPIPSSSAALHHKKSLQCGPVSPGMAASAQKRKCSEGFFNVGQNEFDRERTPTPRKHSQASIFHFRVIHHPVICVNEMF